MTCLKLRLYSRVISDCEWANKLNENSLKAWLYKARAYHEMGEEDKTRDCLKEAESRNPDSKAEIQGKLLAVSFLNHMLDILMLFISSYCLHVSCPSGLNLFFI